MAGSHSSTRKLPSVRWEGSTKVPVRSVARASLSASWHSFLVLNPPLLRCRRLPVIGSGSTNRYQVQVLPRLSHAPAHQDCSPVETPSISSRRAVGTSSRRPNDALASAIQAVASLHADTCQLDHPGGPSASVALLREADQTVDYLVLADSTILLDEPAGIQVISDDRLAQVAVAEHSAMHREATGSLTHQRRYAELVTELRRHRNQADGYWVASSTP